MGGKPRAQTMMKSDEVEAMLHLHALGWGVKRIAREFGCSKNTVRRYVEADGWMAYRTYGSREKRCRGLPFTHKSCRNAVAYRNRWSGPA